MITSKREDSVSSLLVTDRQLLTYNSFRPLTISKTLPFYFELKLFTDFLVSSPLIMNVE